MFYNNCIFLIILANKPKRIEACVQIGSWVKTFAFNFTHNQFVFISSL